MTQTKPKFSTFEQYLSYENETDKLYELMNGELVELPPESGENIEIANFLFALLLPIIGYRRLRGHGLELEVWGEPKNRYPDLTIIREEHLEQLKRRNTIRLSMAPPLLVIEIVSPGGTNRERDYTDKRKQYQDRGIPGFWLIDPQVQVITVLQIENDRYMTVGQFRGGDRIHSTIIEELQLTAEQVFMASK